MQPFEYVRPASLASVPSLLSERPGESAILAGGTDLLDRLKEGIDRPKRVVSLEGLKDLEGIETGEGLRLGALVRIAALEGDDRIARGYRALAEAAAAIANPQLRQMGTLGGNLAQRPRCWYFRAIETPCLKKGGDTCFAVGGLNKFHAVFGDGPCFIVHPSDAAPALIALGAALEILGPKGTRRLPLEDFFRPPADDVARENDLRPNEVIVRIHVPAPSGEIRSTYLKFREKESLDFAVASVAASLRLDGGKVAAARVVLGGVAPVPWRAQEAERALAGKALDARAIAAAAEAAVKGASPLDANGYKLPLVRTLVRRALESLAG